MTTLSPALRASFAELAEREFGLRFDGVRTSALEFSIANACRATGMCPEELLAFARGRDRSSHRVLIDALTVGETYFFREPQHFSWLRSFLARAKGKVRLWSAGCASGEEAYSMALVARECLGSACHERVEIWATDLNPLALARARGGVFRPWSFRAMPADVQARWFRQQGSSFSIHDEIKRLVRFRQQNLVAGAVRPDTAQPEGIEVTFCRNVAPYLSLQGLVALAQNLARVLAPEGVIICGSADPPLRTSMLQLQKSGEIYCYRRAGSAPAPTQTLPATTSRSQAQEPLSASNFADRWQSAEPPSASRILEPEAPQERPPLNDSAIDQPLPRAPRLESREKLMDELVQLTRRIDFNPFEADLYLARAQIQQQLGGHGAAIRDARRALMINSESTRAHVLIALSAFATRRFSVALRSVRLGRRCSPSQDSSLGMEDAPYVLETIERAIHSLRAQ